MAYSNQIADKISILRANPTAMQRMILNTLYDITNGERFIVDPTNPAVFLMEAAVTVASASMLQEEAITRKLYSANAQTDEDLYLHMSDKDYLNRFATPSRTEFTLLLSLDEVLARAVSLNDGTGSKKLTIPKHTEFVVSGLIFTMQYPIDIRVQASGNVSVYYDVTVKSPLMYLESNRASWGLGSMGGSKFIRLTIPVQQMLITTQIATLNNITGLYKEYNFSDQFYYCRAYTKNTADGVWAEIKTTHTEQVYDITEPTVVLKVLDGVLAVKIPQIYFNRSLVKDSLRLDIYTTRGDINVDLSGYESTAYLARWLDHDTVVTSQYSAPLNNFSGLSIFTEQNATGGTDGLSVAALRERVITNGLNNPLVPITDEQLSTSLNAAGYDILTNVDNITDRQFLAIRGLPEPTNKSTVNGAGITIKLFQARLYDLVQHSSVENHGDRVTIKPNTLFRSDSGVISIVSDVEKNALLDPLITPLDVLTNQVNNIRYYYTPFHYVLDVSDNYFSTRAYRLDAPIITSKYLNAENTSLLIDSSTKAHTVDLNPDGSGYRLLIEVAASDVFKALDLTQIHLQLSYVIPGATTRVWINGYLMTPIDPSTDKPFGDNYVYGFDIKTRYDINSSHQMLLEDSQTYMELVNEFDLTYIVSDFTPPGTTTSDIDLITNPSLLDNYTAGIYRAFTHEKVTIEFGSFLEHLWTRSRSVVEDIKYATYDTDVLATYSSTVYAKDASGNIIVSWNDIDNILEYVIEHNVGDPVLDLNSFPTYKYRKGDVMLDNNGEPIPVGGVQGMVRQTDLLLVDGRYYFATSDSTVEYRREMVDLITYWSTTDLSLIANNLLERSNIYYHPQITAGYIDVIANNQQRVSITADQTIKVTFYVREEIYLDSAIKASITTRTSLLLAEAMDATTLSNTVISEYIKDGIGSDVLSVSISGFANDEYSTITVIDSSMKPVVGKRLVTLSNQTLAVQDSVVVDFINHVPRTSKA